MTSSDPTPRPARGDSARAFSIMFFALALLTFMLGWADGVRHARGYLQVPGFHGWLITAIVLAALGLLLLILSIAGRRS